MPEIQFRQLLRPLVDASVVDPEWYVRKYTELSRNADNDRPIDAREHYRSNGYFEHRLPRMVDPVYG